MLTALITFLAAVVAPPDPTVVRAADQILRHQTADGAIVMGALPAKRSHLIPYCANFAACGLVAAWRETGDARFLDAAKRWVAWYEAHMNANGTIYDYDGASGDWRATGDYDSTDSYAATFLDLVSKPELRTSIADLRTHLPFVRRAVAAIRLTLQPNGLTAAKPKWPVMYAMDNIETAGGLHAAAAIGRALGDAALERETGTLVSAMEQAIARDLWDDARQCYRVGVQTSGATVNGQEKWYPLVMANLMAIGWLPPTERHRALLARLKDRYRADIPPTVRREGDLERLAWWGIAARGAGDRALSVEIAAKLAGFDAQVTKFANPALLGHLCRILARD